MADTLAHGLAQTRGLLKNLFEHEVLMLAEPLLLALQGQAGRLSFNTSPAELRIVIPVGSELGDIAIFKINKRVRHGPEREGIGAGKILANAHTQHEGLPCRCHNHRVRCFAVDNGQRIGAFELWQNSLHRGSNSAFRTQSRSIRVRTLRYRCPRTHSTPSL